MEKIMIDERDGWEYKLIGEQYYPTGRVMKDGCLQPETVDANDEPEKDNGPKEGEHIGSGALRLRRLFRYSVGNSVTLSKIRNMPLYKCFQRIGRNQRYRIILKPVFVMNTVDIHSGLRTE